MKVLYLFNFIILILSGSCTPKEAIIEANKKFVIDINQQDKITIFLMLITLLLWKPLQTI